MKIRHKLIKLSVLTGILALSACSGELEHIEETTASQVLLAPVQVTGQANVISRTATPEAAPAGNYLFGWVNAKDNRILTAVTVGTDGTITGTFSVYWENMKLPQTVIFSNSGEIKEADKKTEPVDILWGKLDNQNKTDNALSFVLDHRMAQAEVELTLKDDAASWKVNSIRLTQLKKQYTFSNENGLVAPVGDEGEINISLEKSEVLKESGGSVKGIVMLPPQDKANNTELVVVINDGSNDHTFRRKLPYAMAQQIAQDQWEDIPLKFRAGYKLHITAGITGTSNNEIQFTYATLVDWDRKDTGTASARPAGLYTFNDWQTFAGIYNTPDDSKREVRLARYGTKNSDGSWTFIVQRDIDMTDKIPTPLSNMATNDKLTATSQYKIKGTTANDLGVTDHITGTVFE